jgi:hypothetical protein
MGQETAALRDFNPAYVADGSRLGHSAIICPMCPIAPENGLPDLRTTRRQLFANAAIAASRVAVRRRADTRLAMRGSRCTDLLLCRRAMVILKEGPSTNFEQRSA